MDKENKLILYKDDEGKVNVNVRFADEDVWLTQAQLAEIYNTTQQNISLHQKGIYADGELDEEATHKKYLLVRQEGKRQVQREIDHYNLDMIIALGYRVQSPIAVRFRRWATQRLHEYIQKGFTMDDERLKQGGNHHTGGLGNMALPLLYAQLMHFRGIANLFKHCGVPCVVSGLLVAAVACG